MESTQITYLTRKTEQRAPAARPNEIKNDIAAPATSLFSMLTRLPQHNSIRLLYNQLHQHLG